MWLWWILANAVGYAVGVALWQAAYAEMRLTLRLSVSGIALLAGFAAGFIAAAAISGALSEALEPRLGIPLTDAVIVLLFGAIVGSEERAGCFSARTALRRPAGRWRAWWA
jgi:hypothetical protein